MSDHMCTKKQNTDISRHDHTDTLAQSVQSVIQNNNGSELTKLSLTITSISVGKWPAPPEDT